jgi:predicted NAD/FAD-dependent oxidoreductase
VYLQAQRWGSGLPIDPKKVAPEHTEEVCGTTYASKVKGSVVYSTPPSLTSSSPSQNFVADDAMGLYYGGDFCSHLNPGFEAAALSGFDLAKHILRHKAVP